MLDENIPLEGLKQVAPRWVGGMPGTTLRFKGKGEKVKKISQAPHARGSVREETDPAGTHGKV